MKNTDLHPVELLVLAALVALEAAVVLLAALLALLLTMMGMAKKTAVSRTPLLLTAKSTQQPAPPAHHPLALLADALQQLPHRELMTLAGTRRRLPKYQLAAMVIACS